MPWQSFSTLNFGFGIVSDFLQYINPWPQGLPGFPISAALFYWMKEAEAILLFWLRKNNSSACHHMRSCWKTFPFSEKTFPLYYSNCSIGDYHQKMMQFFKGKGKCMMKLIGLDSPQCTVVGISTNPAPLIISIFLIQGFMVLEKVYSYN